MARMAKFVGVAALALAVSGCVSTEKYNALKLDRDSLAEQLGKSQNDSAAARAEADALKGQLGMLGQNNQGINGLVSNLQQQNATLQAQLDELNRRYAEAMNRPSGSIALPKPLSDELSAFAAQNPDLLDFDAARGIVKFKSDVTFGSGDATVTSRAKEVLARFATILNSPAAAGYELMVAGHTDNTRVANPATIKAGHLDNWYLSAHRAITVSAELRQHNVNPQRLGVVGYADQRPIASNASESGKAQNRRVEVLILPTTVRVAPTDVASSGINHASRSTGTSARRGVMNKDSATVKSDNAPVLNK